MTDIKHLYIHIPFCKKICNYCDFCKMFYNDKFVLKYLEALKKEIADIYQDDPLDTIYIGGGTPSCLTIYELEKLFEIVKQLKLDDNYEFTFECNIEDITKDKLELLKKNRVNRISIGIETFNLKHQKFINRHITFKEALDKIKLIKEYFDNINVDLMYGFKDQNLEELKKDLDLFLKLDVDHISAYSLIIEPHTKLYIDKLEPIDQDLDYEMYKLVNETLSKRYNHYEISNYSLKAKASKHNLAYWNNSNYYGFGLGSSGYIKDVRYTNTRSLTKYLSGNYIYEQEKLSLKEKMENEMILGLRKIKGVNEKDFYLKYRKKIDEVFNINDLLKEKKLVRKDGYLSINPKYLYVSNDILINFI